MSSLGDEETQPRTKSANHNKKHKDTKHDINIDKITHKSKTQPHPINYKARHMYISNNTNNKYTQSQERNQ